MADQMEPEPQDLQTALAMSALAIAFARVLQELNPGEAALSILQGKAAVSLATLRRTPDAERATAMFRFVRDSLRNPEIIEQDETGS